MYLINPTSVIALTIILTILATLAVGLRLAKADRGDTLLHRWKVDDYLCVAALVITIQTIHPRLAKDFGE
jgi:hypothetical protein